MKKFFDYPLAVYVATFANGETVRLSVGARKGKIDFDRARNMVAHMWRDWDQVELQEGNRAELPKVYCNGGYKLQHGPMPGVRTQASIKASMMRYHEMADRMDIVAGYVEHDGRIVADPHFAPKADNVIAMPRRRTAKKVDAVDAILSALDTLSLDDLESVEQLISEMINAKLAA